MTTPLLPKPVSTQPNWPWQAPDATAASPSAQHLPRLTLVTPSYNQGQYLEATLRSVLLQGYPNLEYIVVDGGSTDESVEVIRRYADHLAYWVSEPDRGQSHALVKGFARATGEIFGWLNSDDLLLPGALQRIGQALIDNPRAPFVYGDARHIEPDGQGRSDRPCARPYDRRWMLEHSNMVPQPTAFFRAEAYRAAGGLNEALNWVMDWDLWLRLDQRGAPVFVPSVLAYMRIYPTAKFQTRDRQLYEEVLAMAAWHGGGGLPLSLKERLITSQVALAFNAYQRGENSVAQDELDYALLRAPELQTGSRLPEALAALAWRQYLDHGVEPLSAATKVLEAPPASLREPACLKQEILGLLHAALAFDAARLGRRSSAWRHVRRALGSHARQRANRGLWSLAARAMLGLPLTAPASVRSRPEAGKP